MNHQVNDSFLPIENHSQCVWHLLSCLTRRRLMALVVFAKASKQHRKTFQKEEQSAAAGRNTRRDHRWHRGHWHPFSSLRLLWFDGERDLKKEHGVERRDESKTKSVKISLLSHFWPDFLPEKHRHCSNSINKSLDSVILGIRRPLFIHFIIITHSVPRHHFRQISIFKFL